MSASPIAKSYCLTTKGQTTAARVVALSPNSTTQRTMCLASLYRLLAARSAYLYRLLAAPQAYPYRLLAARLVYLLRLLALRLACP